jgi:hypothetical protein
VEKAKHNQERKAVEKGQVAQKAREESLSKKEPVHHRHLFSKQHQSHAGKMLVEKRGREYMSQIGKRGYATTLARYPNFHLEGARLPGASKTASSSTRAISQISRLSSGTTAKSKVATDPKQASSLTVRSICRTEKGKKFPFKAGKSGPNKIEERSSKADANPKYRRS